MGPFAGETEVLIPAGYVQTVCDATFTLSPDKRRYIPTNNNRPATVPAPGLPASLVFRAEPGREDVILRVASAYQMASRRRVPPPMYQPLPGVGIRFRSRSRCSRCIIPGQRKAGYERFENRRSYRACVHREHCLT
jgi:hypothetical protein